MMRGFAWASEHAPQEFSDWVSLDKTVIQLRAALAAAEHDRAVAALRLGEAIASAVAGVQVGDPVLIGRTGTGAGVSATIRQIVWTQKARVRLLMRRTDRTGRDRAVHLDDRDTVGHYGWETR